MDTNPRKHQLKAQTNPKHTLENPFFPVSQTCLDIIPLKAAKRLPPSGETQMRLILPSRHVY